MEWVRFFLGTPRRFLTTFSIVALLLVVAFPGLLRFAIERLLIEISPLFGPAFGILLLAAAFRLIFKR